MDVPSTRTDPQEMYPLLFSVKPKEREESKEFSDCVVLNSLTREKGDTKEFKREKGMKMMNSTSFQGLENQKTSESFWYKEEEEVQRDSRLVKDCINKCSRFLRCKTKPCFYRLFMSGQEDHLEEL
ncbi:hypothetical protein HKD37_19G053827 [Glycine soja]